MLFGFCALAQKTPRKRTPFFWFVFFSYKKKMNNHRTTTKFDGARDIYVPVSTGASHLSLMGKET